MTIELRLLYGPSSTPIAEYPNPSRRASDGRYGGTEPVAEYQVTSEKNVLQVFSAAPMKPL